MGETHNFSGHRKSVHDFACLKATCMLEGNMQAIPEDSWHNFQIDCLNIVQDGDHKMPESPDKFTHTRSRRGNAWGVQR